MRILHLNTEKGFRGGEQQVVNLIEGLAALDASIEQACLLRTGEALEKALSSDPLRLYPWKRSPLDFLFGNADLRQAVREFQPTILHAHTGNSHALGFRAMKALRKNSAQQAPKFIVTRRVDFPPKTNMFSRSKYANSFTHYVAISSAIRDILINAGVSEQRVTVIPSGIDPQRFRFSPEARTHWRGQWKAAPEALVVGMVGSYVDHKDPLNLINAAAHLKTLCQAETPPRDMRVVLIGEGELRPQLEARRDELGLQQELILTGWQTAVGDLLSALDLFVMPSKLEGLCTSLLDAQAIGLPCVATSAGGIPDIINHGENGLLVAPQNPEALACSIHKLALDSTMQQRFVEAGKERVQRGFTLQSMCRQYHDYYQRLLAD